MTIVDSHLHVDYMGLSLNDLIKYLDNDGIDYCWLLSWEEVNPGPWFYQHLSVKKVYEAYLKYPSRIIPFYAPDPHRPDATVLMEKWFLKGIRGCGELKATLNWESTAVINILTNARKLNMPVLFHMENSGFREMPYSRNMFDKTLFYGLRTKKTIFRIPTSVLTLMVNHYSPLKKRAKSPYSFPGYMLDFASLETTLDKYPTIPFIAHGLMFWNHISSESDDDDDSLPKTPVKGEGIIWRLLRDYPNLYADISGNSGFNALKRDTMNAKKFLNIFNHKILFGTDNFALGQKQYLDSLNLSVETYRKIYGENASKIINLR